MFPLPLNKQGASHYKQNWAVSTLPAQQTDPPPHHWQWRSAKLTVRNIGALAKKLEVALYFSHAGHPPCI